MNQPGGGFGGSGLVETARSFIGRGNPTARGRLWCAAFMNLVLGTLEADAQDGLREDVVLVTVKRW